MTAIEQLDRMIAEMEASGYSDWPIQLRLDIRPLLATIPPTAPSATTPSVSDEGLDAAWKAAKAARRGNLYLAEKPDGRYVAGVDAGPAKDAYAYGETPEAALCALATTSEEPVSGGS